ncbi:MAG: hypothetical protein V4556_13730 [Bacteroidota bacterium]
MIKLLTAFKFFILFTLFCFCKIAAKTQDLKDLGTLSPLGIPPEITNYTPMSQYAGGTVTIYYNPYGVPLSVSAVSFGGTSAISFIHDAVNKKITAFVGAGSSSGNVSVTTNLGIMARPYFVFVSGDAPNYVNIPDTNFRSFLKAQYPACFNGFDMMDTTCTPILSEQSLVCSGLNISDLQGIQYFKKLEMLECSNNKLNHLPALTDSLYTLFCINNQLTDLPKLPARIAELQCSKNQLTRLPALPESLSVLYCDFNLIDILPALPEQMTYLNCGSNNLTSLPALPNILWKLFCPKNKLTALPALPDSLSELGCSFNKLTSLPSLPNKLFALYCDSNQLSSLPPLPDELGELMCGSNHNLRCLPKLPYFTTLYVDSGTKLQCLPNSIQYTPTQYYYSGAYKYIPSNLSLGLGADRLNYGDLTALYLPVCNEIGNAYSCPIYQSIQNIDLCPSTINTTITSSLIGNTYKWQIDTCSDTGGVCFQNLNDNGSIITGTNTASLNLSNMKVYGHKYQFRCMVDNNYNDIYRINFLDAWTGGTSSAWENNSNWSCGKVPDINTDVIVNSGTIIITASNVVCRSLTVSPNATVTVATGGKLTVVH